MKAMILAAGYGKRMRPLTDHTPKPLLKVGGKALIEYHIEKLARAGIHDLVINSGWRGDRLAATLGDGSRYGVRIHYSHEGTPLETAGGIRKALPLLGDEPFVLVNGDIWTDYDLGKLMAPRAEPVHLVLVNNPAHHPEGDFHLTDTGRVRDNGPLKLTYAGMGRFDPALFADLPEGEAKLAPLLRAAMADDAVSGEHHGGQWWDIGTPERLHELDTLLRAKAGSQ